MSSLEARTGRLRQRYENNFRLVSGCIPYRIIKGDEDEFDDIKNRIEVVMVSSPNRSDLVFPKGGWEDDETVKEAACREAMEEAGVKGILRENPLGVWEFRSKSSQDLHSQVGSCKGYMFALEVTEELECWPEQENRRRKWLKIEDAFELCRYAWMREALEKFLTVMTKELQLELEEEIAESPSLPLPEDLADQCQIIPSICSVNPQSSQHHGIGALSGFPWQIRLPLT